jgi:hypothetical protein
MDALKPEMYSVKDGQAGALHEAFADLTAIFATLSHLDLCDNIVANTKGDLRSSTYLSGIGEEFGDALSEGPMPAEEIGDGDEPTHSSTQRGVRNANNSLKASEAGDLYDLAGVFTGYIYDILCDVFEHERNPKMRDDAETLFRVARILRRTLLLALFNTTAKPDFLEVSKAMEHAVNVVVSDDEFDVEYWKERIAKYRVERELGASTEKESVDFGLY